MPIPLVHNKKSKKGLYENHRLFILILSISACATANADSLSRYVDSERPKAVAGTLKWSDYYKGVYKELSESNYPEKGFEMALAADSIDKALEFEAGKVSQDEFDSFKRKQEAARQTHYSEVRARQDATQTAEPTQRRKVEIYKLDPDMFKRKGTNCITTKMGDTYQTHCQ